jgi:hypothetical protein
MVDSFAKATAIGGLPVPIAAIALPRPVSPCFPELESRNLNRLRLISFASRARALPSGARPSITPTPALPHRGGGACGKALPLMGPMMGGFGRGWIWCQPAVHHAERVCLGKRRAVIRRGVS